MDFVIAALIVWGTIGGGIYAFYWYDKKKKREKQEREERERIEGIEFKRKYWKEKYEQYEQNEDKPDETRELKELIKFNKNESGIILISKSKFTEIRKKNDKALYGDRLAVILFTNERIIYKGEYRLFVVQNSEVEEIELLPGRFKIKFNEKSKYNQIEIPTELEDFFKIVTFLKMQNIPLKKTILNDSEKWEITAPGYVSYINYPG